MVRQEPPALGRLALDIGLAGLALGVERVERNSDLASLETADIDPAAPINRAAVFDRNC